MIAIPNMDKPKKGEVVAFDGEYAVYTDDRMNVHRYPLIEIDLVRCGECKQLDHTKWCDLFLHYMNEDDFCSYGERRADETQP